MRAVNVHRQVPVAPQAAPLADSFQNVQVVGAWVSSPAGVVLHQGVSGYHPAADNVVTAILACRSAQRTVDLACRGPDSPAGLLP